MIRREGMFVHKSVCVQCQMLLLFLRCTVEVWCVLDHLACGKTTKEPHALCCMRTMLEHLLNQA